MPYIVEYQKKPCDSSPVESANYISLEAAAEFVMGRTDIQVISVMGEDGGEERTLHQGILENETGQLLRKAIDRDIALANPDKYLVFVSPEMEQAIALYRLKIPESIVIQPDH